MEQLTRRFTPVRIGAVQSSLFHDRRQREKESVDDYAQELRKLFYKAYPQAMQGTTALEDISKSILCNQFVAGLLPDIKIKVAGTEGSFETLLGLRKQNLETLEKVNLLLQKAGFEI